MKTLIELMMILILSSCTYSYTFTQAQTDGIAQDVIDETSTVSPSNSVKVPVNITP